MKTFTSLLLITVALAISVASWFDSRIPSESEIKGCITTKMYKVHLCPGSDSYVPLNKISPFLPKAVVTTEDSLFWQHQGFDWDAIEKSARENIEKGTYKRGGSTITQQLAKNMFLTTQKNLTRKFFEAFITYKIEKVLSKKEIIERYLNVVEFGENIYGVKSAAEFYFKKTPGELNAVECAFLAMVLPNPKKYARSFYKKELTAFASNRIRVILDLMYRFQKITEPEYQTALGQMSHFLVKNAQSSEGVPSSESPGNSVDEFDRFYDQDSEADHEN